jgi:hypothetical protein
MIGVIAGSSESRVVCEFFELFKVPWEWYRSGKRYDVLICARDEGVPENEAKLVLLYGGRPVKSDATRAVKALSQGGRAGMLLYKQRPFPIYGQCVSFRDGSRALIEEVTGHAVMHVTPTRANTVVRIGYDLFDEVRQLLTKGQPVANAGVPTLDLHISLLREVIMTNGATLAEIPPIPAGHRFIACLTHDVDHPSIRKHKLDHTALGFWVRAVLGSLVKTLYGRMTVRDLLTNWSAALKLPFVQLGIAKDFWLDFADRYAKIERDRPSTFFLIPYSNRPGHTRTGSASSFRASAYRAIDIVDIIRKLRASGCEIGLHGIDAWHNSSQGSEELKEIRHLAGTPEIGVRMHWLYYDAGSPAALEEAGAAYDSTVGYNETVGYRAGTTQAYMPLGATRLLELPLHIMDTALFFPSHLNLSFKAALKRVSAMIENAVQFGGVVTINWHDRSIAPERCWGEFYGDLLCELERSGAWLATAGEAVAWFRKRRAATFDLTLENSGQPGLSGVDGCDGLPSLQLRLHNVRQNGPAQLTECKA